MSQCSKKVFSKKKYIECEGYDDYLDNQDWIDDLDSTYVYPSEKHYETLTNDGGFLLLEKWCMQEGEVYGRSNARV